MFFNVGGAEILVIALVALIAVGPEQLPGVMRKVGAFVAQARAMTMGLRDEFMSGLDEVTDLADPEKWMGSGSDDDPIIPRGYAKTQTNGAASAPETAASSDEVASDVVDSESANDGTGTGGADTADDVANPRTAATDSEDQA